MEKVAINLLPQEFSQKQSELKKLRSIQAASALIILLMIFLASVTLALRIIQLREFQRVEVKAKEAESEVSELKDTEASLTILKNRVDIIRQIKNFPSKTATLFDEALKLIPAEILVSSSSVDRNGIILLSTISPSSGSLGKLLGNILGTEKSELFKKVEIESLSSGRDGVYRANFKILPK